MFLIVLSLAFAQAFSKAAVSIETVQQPMLVPSSSSSSSRVLQGIRLGGGGEGGDLLDLLGGGEVVA